MKIHLQKKNFVPPKFWKYQHDERDLQKPSVSYKITLFSRVYVSMCQTLKHIYFPSTNGCVFSPPKQLAQHFVRKLMRFLPKPGHLIILLDLKGDSEKSMTFIVTIWVFPKIEVPQNGWWKDGKPYQNGWFGGYHYFRKHPSSWWFCTTEPAATIGKTNVPSAVKWRVFHPWVGGKTNNDPPFQQKGDGLTNTDSGDQLRMSIAKKKCDPTNWRCIIYGSFNCKNMGPLHPLKINGWVSINSLEVSSRENLPGCIIRLSDPTGPRLLGKTHRHQTKKIRKNRWVSIGNGTMGFPTVDGEYLLNLLLEVGLVAL